MDTNCSLQLVLGFLVRRERANGNRLSLRDSRQTGPTIDYD